MHFVQPSEGEWFYLRQLLLNVPGATSFEDLKTTHDPEVVHDTFKAACLARGLLQDDSEWSSCMMEAALFSTGKQLRNLFINILLFNEVMNPLDLWNTYKDDMSQDFFYQASIVNIDQVLDDEILNLTLTAISLDLMTHGKTLQDYGLPTPTPILPGHGYILIDQERAKYDASAQAQL